MLVNFGAPTVEAGAAGDTVTTRKVRFGSQQEQIMWLRGMVDEYRGVYAIRSRARDIVFRQRGCAPKDQVCQALAIGSWVQDTITYVQELPETFQTPTSTVAQGYGDCDDFTTLIGALCESIGIETQLVGMEWGRGTARYFRHIFPRAIIPRGGRLYVIPLDATSSSPVDGTYDPITVAQRQGVRGLRLFVA